MICRTEEGAKKGRGHASGAPVARQCCLGPEPWHSLATSAVRLLLAPCTPTSQENGH